MPLTPVELAVLNNVCWYQAMFEAHGIAYQIDSIAFHSTDTPPPFHSNLVVLTKEASQAEIEAKLREISAGAGGRRSWGLKDSYSNLNLNSIGYKSLFSAQWIWLPATAKVVFDADDSVAWTRIETPTDLVEWEFAWAGMPTGGDATGISRQFPTSLLKRQDFAFLAGRVGHRIVAGAVVNQSPNAVGISNFFAARDGGKNIWPALVRLARDAFPGFPLVGYARGESLQQAMQAGFVPVGELRVLQHQPE